MARKSTHPEKKLFDYINGRLDEPSTRDIQNHLLDCPDCSSSVELIRGLKAGVASIRTDLSASHPDASQLAEFFYGDPKKQRSTAAHAAACADCADEIALLARAERLAADYDPSEVTRGQVPDSSWKQIREWEESVYARPKVESYESSREMIEKLALILIDKKGELRELAEKSAPSEPSVESPMVPVIIVDQQADTCRVSLFERTIGESGQSILRAAGETGRFDNRQFHILYDFGEEDRIVVSDIVRNDTIKLQRIERAGNAPRRVDFFIIEE
jgi:hypothetical protein